MNIKTIYQQSILRLNNSPSAELDTRVLIGFALKKDSDFVFSHPEFELSQKQINDIDKLIKRRAEGEPVVYIIGKKEFYGLDFKVNKNVLIPRPETEWLVEKALEFIESRPTTDYRLPISIIDIGTGSGNIIISIIMNIQQSSNETMKQLSFYAIDINAKALDIAKQNARYHNVDDRITFLKSDLFSNPKLPKKFDLIIANLPYVPSQNKRTYAYNTIIHEPQKAIFADDNGAEIIKRFLDQAKNRINNNGLILIELDPRNAQDIKDYAQNIFIDSKIELKKDLANLDRYLVLSNSIKRAFCNSRSATI